MRQTAMRLGDEEATRTLGQYFTPPWLAEAIVERHFAWLGKDDVVCEPSCGLGAFLQSIPDEIEAFGVEVDEALARRCRELTGRQVIAGAFEAVRLPAAPTAVIGNPPFKTSVIDQFLDRSYKALPNEGVVGLILPAFVFQTSGRVVRYAERWGIQTEMIPRNVYPRLSKPLVFAMFRKGQVRTLVGMAFYYEAAAVAAMAKEIKAIFTEQGGPMWPRAVEAALLALGGKGKLREIYRVIEGKQPTPTRFWREQVRRVLQERFIRTGPGEWAHPNWEEVGPQLA